MDSLSVLGYRKEISSGASDINRRLVELSAHQGSVYKRTFLGLISFLISSDIIRENTNTGAKTHRNEQSFAVYQCYRVFFGGGGLLEISLSRQL
jgi:hypothetical protein